MFRNVPGCSGMFHVPGFVNALSLDYISRGRSRFASHSLLPAVNIELLMV